MKNKQEIKMIMTDVDGTLLNDEGKIGPENIKEIINSTNNKIYFVINTGALPMDGERWYKEANIEINDYLKWFIGVNGCIVYNFKSNNSYINLKYTSREMLFKGIESKAFTDYKIELIDGEEFLIIHTVNFNTWYDLLYTIYPYINQTDKLIGLNSFLKILKVVDNQIINKSEIIYFGDNLNDLPIFKHPEIYSIAVDNAISEIKELSDEMTSYKNDGIANYLNKIK